MREYVRVTGDIWQEQTTIDWEQRRYEIAKDILTAYYSNSDRLMRQGTAQRCAADAVEVADTLIEELQKRRTKS